MTHRARYSACVGALALLGAHATATGGDVEAQFPPQPPSIVFLVRHAEKAVDDPADPALSDAGRRRAGQLAAMLAESHVTHLFSSEYRRTQQTLEPLSKAASLPITVVAAKSPAAQVAALLALPAGSVAVVAGHSNTVPALACTLANSVPGFDCRAAGGPRFDEQRFDQLILVVRPDGSSGSAPAAVVLHYGD